VRVALHLARTRIGAQPSRGFCALHQLRQPGLTQLVPHQPSKREYPQFADGLRQLTILQAAMDSNRRHAWVDVLAFSR